MYDFDDFISGALKFIALVVSAVFAFYLGYSVVTAVGSGETLFSSRSCSCSCCEVKGGEEE